MSEKILKNSIIFRGEDLEPVEGYIWLQDGIIKEIGQGSPPKSGEDLNKSFIIPPFFNSHIHLGDSIAKEIYGNKAQPEVVGESGKKFEILDSATRKRIISGIKKSLLEMKRSGTFAYCDFREGGLEGVKTLKEAKIESMKSIILSRPTKKGELKKLIVETEGIGIPSFEQYSESELNEISEMTLKNNKYLSIHVSETKKAHEKSIKKTGKSEIERAIDLKPSFLIHGTWSSEEDLELLEENKIPLVLCPKSNSLLSCGLPPIKKALEKDVPLWLGTDNVSVCTPVILEELSFAWSVLRLQSENAGELEAKKLLKAATINPTKEFNVNFGPLEPGKRAAFVVLERKRNLSNCENPFMCIVNRARFDNIKTDY